MLAPEHDLVDRVTTAAQRDAVVAYKRYAAAGHEVDRQANKKKTASHTGPSP